MKKPVKKLSENNKEVSKTNESELNSTLLFTLNQLKAVNEINKTLTTNCEKMQDDLYERLRLLEDAEQLTSIHSYMILKEIPNFQLN